MGNAVVKLTPCLAVRGADEHAPSCQCQCQAPTTVVTTESSENRIGQTISFKRDATQQDSDSPTTMRFQTIHCVSLGANQLTPSSIMNNTTSFSTSSSFSRSSSFSSFALHPSSSSFSSSDPSYSGILVRSDSTILREIQAARDRRNQEKLEHPSLLSRFAKAISSRIKKYKGGFACGSDVGTVQGTCDEGRSDATVHWAEGKAGEDRVHMVYLEEHKLLFVGIYDGFNGPDAPDFLLKNLHQAILLELKGIRWEQQEHQLVVS